MARQAATQHSHEQYWIVRNEFTVLDGTLLKGTRIVIPLVMRSKMLEKLHMGHQGIVKCKK